MLSLTSFHLGEAVKKNPTFLTLRKLDVAKDIASIIAKSQSKVYLPSDILLLNNLGITSSTQRVSTATDKKNSLAPMIHNNSF